MPISESDIKYFKSSTGASAGGAISATEIVDDVLNNLWEDFSDVDVGSNGTRIKKWFLKNTNGTADALVKPKVWISPTPNGFSNEEIGLGFDDADDDLSAQGNMTAFGANAKLALISSAADSRAATVYGLDAAGEPVTEAMVLNGTTEVLSVATFSKVYAVKLASESGSLTVLAKQGTGGTTRGTIGPNAEACFLWVAALTEGTAVRLSNLIAGANYGFWDRLTWLASGPSGRPTASIPRVKES